MKESLAHIPSYDQPGAWHFQEAREYAEAEVEALISSMSIDSIAGPAEQRKHIVDEIGRIYRESAPSVPDAYRDQLLYAIARPIAERTTGLIRMEIEEGRVTPDLLNGIRRVPVNIHALHTDLDALAREAVALQARVLRESGRQEFGELKERADDFTRVTAYYGLDIPKHYGGISGQEYKVDQVRAGLRKARQIKDVSEKRRHLSALGEFSKVGYGKGLHEFELAGDRFVSIKSRILEEDAGRVRRAAIAAAALLGVAGPVIVATPAHAAPEVHNSREDREAAEKLDTARVTGAKAPKLATIENLPVPEVSTAPPLFDQEGVREEIIKTQPADNTVVAAKVVDHEPKIEEPGPVETEAPAIVAVAEERKPDLKANPAPIETIVMDEADGLLIVATPSERKADEVKEESSKLVVEEDGQPIVVATPEETDRSQMATVEIPKEEPAPIAPAPTEAPKSEQTAAPQNDFVVAAQKLTERGGVWERRGVAMKFFIEDPELAMTPSQAAGFVGNLLGEAGPEMNPGQSQYGGPAFGIVQWEGGRLLDLGAFAGKNQADFMTQLQFIKYELLGKERAAFNALKTATNRRDAALIVRQTYERPSVHRDEERIGYANEVGDAYNEEYKKIISARVSAEVAPAPSNQLAGWPTTGEKAMELFNQCDPRWGNILSPNGIRTCNIACGPTNVAMAVKMLKPEVAITPKETIELANAKRLWLTPQGGAPDSGGTTFDAVIRLANHWGVKGNQMGPNSLKNFEAYKQILSEGGVIIAAGSGPIPFVSAPKAHFVMIRGVTNDGKFLVADPYPKTPDTNTVAWDANQIMQSTFGAVVLYN